MAVIIVVLHPSTVCGYANCAQICYPPLCKRWVVLAPLKFAGIILRCTCMCLLCYKMFLLEMTDHSQHAVWSQLIRKIVNLSLKDFLSEDRAIGDPSSADKSNFLHPVLYYYKEPIEGMF